MSHEADKQQVIDAICARTNELLAEHWDEITEIAEKQEGRVKLSFAHRISYRGDDQVVKSSIACNHGFKDSIETTIENGEQLGLFGTNGANAGDARIVGTEGEEIEEEASEPESAKPERKSRKAKVG